VAQGELSPARGNVPPVIVALAFPVQV